MNKELQREEKKQYLHYFRFWFLTVGVLVLVALGKLVIENVFAQQIVGGRSNTEAPAERVYDYADVLTQEEENALREYIADCEKKNGFDIVLVTVKEYMGDSDWEWERTMMNYADDFYDENSFGYNRVYGDGVLLLDNWQEGQKGSWLSTCGAVFASFGDAEIDEVLDAVYGWIETDPYKAYKAYIDTSCRIMKSNLLPSLNIQIPWRIIFILPLMIAFGYAIVMKAPFKQERSVGNTAYVAGGKPVLNDKKDEFKNKTVTSIRIANNSSGGGSGGKSSGGGGSHRSSGGVSHGGGGRRR